MWVSCEERGGVYSHALTNRTRAPHRPMESQGQYLTGCLPGDRGLRGQQRLGDRNLEEFIGQTKKNDSPQSFRSEPSPLPRVPAVGTCAPTFERQRFLSQDWQGGLSH